MSGPTLARRVSLPSREERGADRAQVEAVASSAYARPRSPCRRASLRQGRVRVRISGWGGDGWRVAERRRGESPGRGERRGRGRGLGEGREVAGGGSCGSHRAALAAPTGGDRSPGPPGGTPRQSRQRFFGRRLGPHRRRQRPSAQRLRRRGPAPRDDNALRSGETRRRPPERRAGAPAHR